LTSLRVYDRLSLTLCGAKGSKVNRPLGVITRVGLAIALAGAATCVVVLASVLPARAAVELAYFYVSFRTNDVLIEWGTVSEVTTWGFNLYRAETEQFSQAHLLNENVIEASMQPGGDRYSYVDSSVEAGVTYYYWLEVLDSSGDKVFGPEPRPTPTATSTSTGTAAPTATSPSVPTRTPTPTSTSVPTVAPSFTATGAPTSTPAGTPSTTTVLPTPSSPSPTSVIEQRLSPTVTPGGTTQPTLTPGPVYEERTPTPSTTIVVVAAETSAATTVAWGGDSGPRATGWSSFLFRWSTIQPSTILLLISLMSLLGALLLTVALALVRKLSL